KNPLFGDGDRLDTFLARGDQGYQAADTDNSADERAVEVHIFLGNVKPIPPPNIRPLPPTKPPLPGGPRFLRWSVAAVFGLQVPIPGLSVGPAGLNITGNLYAFKKIDGGEEVHWYFGIGPGASVSVPGLGPFKNFQQLWGFITAPSWSGVSFSDPVTAKTAFNFDDLSGADVVLGQAGGGVKPPSVITPVGGWFVPTGFQVARLNVSNKMWHY